MRRRTAALLGVAGALTLITSPAPGQQVVLPWEVAVAEVEAGRLRSLAQRLSRQNILYQLHLGDARKSDLVETASRVDRILESLREGSPAQSIPAAWTPALREQVARVDAVWGQLRAIAVADPYQHLEVKRQFLPRGTSRGDPLLVRYFDHLSLDFVEESEKLLYAYHQECQATGLEVCQSAFGTGYNAMLIERATKEAIYVVAGIDANLNRKRLKNTLAAYEEQREANDANPFFAAALDPARGASARAAGALLMSLRGDWSAMLREFAVLDAGDETNFDLRELLATQSQLIEKVERLTGALFRYASATYGG